MKIKNCIFIFFVILMCCISSISAVSNNTTENILFEMDSNSELVSVNDNEKMINDDENNVILSSQDEFTNLTISDEQIINDNEDHLEINDVESKYLEDIKSSTSDEYYYFINYLIKQKGFRFNSKTPDDSYTIFSNLNYESKLYDGGNYILLSGNNYFISKNRISYVIDEYYPDVLYIQNNDIYLDELYLGWLKWVENYHPTLNIGGTNTPISFSVSQSLSSQQFLSSNFPSYFDLRKVDNKYNYLTPVKNQDLGGNCWAFASIAALESFLLKSEGKTYDFSEKYDFSENNLKNVMSSLGRQGTHFIVNDGGRTGMSIAYFLRWSGPISEALDEYLLDEYGNPINNVPLEFDNSEKHVQGVKYIQKRENSNDNNEIKQAIMDYGAVVTTMWMENEFPYLDKNNLTYFYFGPVKSNHEVCIVGWNDAYSRNNFVVAPEGDGAFIVRNSWGSDWGDNGYFYVSYYDSALACSGDFEMNNASGFVFTSVQDKINYDINYNYNPLGITYWWNIKEKYAKYRNQWIASSNEILKACGVYVDGAVICDIEVYVNDNDKVCEQKNIKLNYAGFHTIDLKTPVKLSKDQKFRIELKIQSNNYVSVPVEISRPVINSAGEIIYYMYDKASSNFGESEFFYNGKWNDINEVFSNANLCINVFTDYDSPIPTKFAASDLTMDYGETKKITTTLLDIKDNKLKNYGINILFNNINLDIQTNDEGQASIDFGMGAGTYKINMNFFGNERYRQTNKTITVTVNQVVINVQPINLQPTTSQPTVNLPVSGSNTNIQTNPVITKPTSTVKILKISGISDGKTYGYTATCNLKLSQNVDLIVNLKVGNKKYNLKFNKGKSNLKFSKYNLKKGNKYKFTFTGGNSKYEIKKLAVTIKTK